MLTDPRDELAEQNTVATALTGLASLARVVRALAADGRGSGPPAPADDLVHLLLAVVSLGEAATRLAAPAAPAPTPPPPIPPRAWLR